MRARLYAPGSDGMSKFAASKSRISAAATSGASSTSGGRTRVHAESPLQWAMACFIAAIIGVLIPAIPFVLLGLLLWGIFRQRPVAA